jgi:LDH2 family malate/lactate/ureidoglycolate dehydrogenase
LLPGERGSRTEAARRKTGIPIPTKLWEELAAMAKADGVKMPDIGGAS